MLNKVYSLLTGENEEGVKEVTTLIELLYGKKAKVLDIEKLKGEVSKKELKKDFKDIDLKNALTINDYGGFHHYTYGLCSKFRNFAYLHCDEHTDYNNFSKSIKEVNCGDFVGYIEHEFNAVVYDVGTGSEREKPLEEILKEKKPFYISVDLDVLREGEITTAWSMNIDGPTIYQFTKKLKRVIKEKKVIGADIVGYAKLYRDSLKTIVRSPLVCAIVAGTLLEKDTSHTQELLRKVDIGKIKSFEEILEKIGS